jgi:uncharacterized protein YqeY
MAEIANRLNADIITAMKARDEFTLTTLRMVKSALKSKEIDTRKALTDADEQSILTTMIKQRKDSFEQFTKGGRPELAEKEQREIALIDAYMPKAAGDEEIAKIVAEAVGQVTKDNGGAKPGPKDMGTVMKIARARSLADGLRVDGGKLSELIKTELAKA